MSHDPHFVKLQATAYFLCKMVFKIAAFKVGCLMKFFLECSYFVSSMEFDKHISKRVRHFVANFLDRSVLEFFAT
jgi:hypothetical protein